MKFWKIESCISDEIGGVIWLDAAIVGCGYRGRVVANVAKSTKNSYFCDAIRLLHYVLCGLIEKIAEKYINRIR